MLYCCRRRQHGNKGRNKSLCQGVKKGPGCLGHFTFLFFLLHFSCFYFPLQMTQIKCGDFLPAILRKRTCIFNFSVACSELLTDSFQLVSCPPYGTSSSLFFSFLLNFSFPWRLLDKHMDCVKMI